MGEEKALLQQPLGTLNSVAEAVQSSKPWMTLETRTATTESTRRPNDIVVSLEATERGTSSHFEFPVTPSTQRHVPKWGSSQVDSEAMRLEILKQSRLPSGNGHRSSVVGVSQSEGASVHNVSEVNNSTVRTQESEATLHRKGTKHVEARRVIADGRAWSLEHQRYTGRKWTKNVPPTVIATHRGAQWDMKVSHMRTESSVNHTPTANMLQSANTTSASTKTK